jgi:uncharacterized protein (DUF4415 family)
MRKRPSPTLVDADSREWTKEMFARAKPAAAVFPDLVEHAKKVKRLQKKSGPKSPRRGGVGKKLK